jgi:2-methylisocitrate lyase-like PEP mutase family enzyme
VDKRRGDGNAKSVSRTSGEYSRTGGGRIEIEDQTFPKEDRNVKERQLIPKEEAVGKYRAAADVRDERDEDFVIIARTDARGAVGGSLDMAIDRANAYCDAGADVAFVEGPVDEDEIARVGEEVDAPLLYNFAGISPKLPPDRLEELGFDIVIIPGFSFQAAILSIYNNVQKANEDGIVALYESYEAGFDELPFDYHEFAGFPEVVQWEEEYLPADEGEKYTDTVGADITATKSD